MIKDEINFSGRNITAIRPTIWQFRLLKNSQKKM